MVAGIRAVVGGENSAYNILIEFQAKRQIDLLCNAGTTVSWIASFHFDYGFDHFLGWSLGSRFAVPTGEYSCRYFRFFNAEWNRSRVDGLMIIADLAIRVDSKIVSRSRVELGHGLTNSVLVVWGGCG